MDFEAKSCDFTIDGSKHWMVKGSIALNNDIITRDINNNPKSVSSVSVLPNTVKIEKLKKYLKTVEGCTITRTKKTPKGLLVNVNSKPAPLDRVLRDIVTDTGSRVWTRSKPDRFVDVHVECPWDLNLKKMVSDIVEKHNLKLIDKIQPKKSTMEVPIPFYDQNKTSEIDEKDKELAKQLFLNGYFDTQNQKLPIMRI